MAPVGIALAHPGLPRLLCSWIPSVGSRVPAHCASLHRAAVTPGGGHGGDRFGPRWTDGLDHVYRPQLRSIDCVWLLHGCNGASLPQSCPLFESAPSRVGSRPGEHLLRGIGRGSAQSCMGLGLCRLRFGLCPMGPAGTPDGVAFRRHRRVGASSVGCGFIGLVQLGPVRRESAHVHETECHVWRTGHSGHVRYKFQGGIQWLGV